MRIKVTRTGGIAGVTVAAEVDTATLDPAVAARVEGGVNRLLDAPPAETPPPHPDAFTYRVAVAGRTATLHEREVPAELHPLVEAVRNRGRLG